MKDEYFENLHGGKVRILTQTSQIVISGINYKIFHPNIIINIIKIRLII